MIYTLASSWGITLWLTAPTYLVCGHVLSYIVYIIDCIIIFILVRERLGIVYINYRTTTEITK